MSLGLLLLVVAIVLTVCFLVGVPTKINLLGWAVLLTQVYLLIGPVGTWLH